MSKSLPVAAEELFAAFPGRRSLTRAEAARGGSTHLAVEVAAPEAADVEHGLVGRRNACARNISAISMIVIFFSSLISCGGGMPVKPDFDLALQQHFAAISNRDIEAFKSHLTRGDTLYTIVQNGHAFTTPSETIEIHRQWFKDPNWIWEGSVVHKVVGDDVAMALVKYQYRQKAEDAPISTWLTYVFQLQDGQWRIVHDQNTALDYVAFARAAGIEIK